MDTLKNKTYENYGYKSRYTHVPYYYDTLRKRDVYGIGSNMSKDTPYVSVTIKQNDTLDSLSLTYYNNPTYWWVIAYFNDIQDPFIKLSSCFTKIKIPNISSIKFEETKV